MLRGGQNRIKRVLSARAKKKKKRIDRIGSSREWGRRVGGSHLYISMECISRPQVLASACSRTQVRSVYIETGLAGTS